MKIPIEEGSVAIDAVMEKLETQFTDYSITKRSKKMMVAKKSGSVGCNIMLRKKQILVTGSFPTFGGQILFALCIVLLGVIIPLLIFFIAFNKKMKVMENEIGDFLQSEFGTT